MPADLRKRVERQFARVRSASATEAQLERYGPEIERGRQPTELLVELGDAELTRVERVKGWGA